MALSKNAETIVKKLYCHQNETVKDVFKRVSNTLSLGDEKFEKQLYNAMIKGYFLPNSPALKNAGVTNFLHACFVLGIEDDIENIFDTVRKCGIIFKFGGGVGINYSPLRPVGAKLSSGGTSSGVLSFIGIFDSIINAVKQGGMRRGAMMGILNYSHPEIINFIRSKLHPQKFTNFNFSILVDDNFMNSVKNNKKINLIYRNEVWNSIGARDLFDLICFSVWNTGDPGLLFYEALNRDNITNEKIYTTNPCLTGDTEILTIEGKQKIKDLVGKQVKVISYDIEKNKFVVSLMKNIRLTKKWTEVLTIYLDNGEKIKCTPDHLFLTTEKSYIEAQKLKKRDTLLSLHNLTNENSLKVIDIERLNEHKDVYDGEVENYHNFALASGVIVHNCGEIGLTLNEACTLGSINLSKFVKRNQIDFKKLEQYIILGTRTLLNVNAVANYPDKDIAKKMKKYNRIGLGVMGFAELLIKLGVYYDSEEALKIIDELGSKLKEISDKIAKKSVAKRTIAPTGTISRVANTTSGIEPPFAREYISNLNVGKLKEGKDIFSSKYCRTAHEISPEWHLKIQARWQQYIDNAVSKTINLPNNTTVEDIKNIYVKAHQLGCKGITVFREGSKEGVLKKVSQGRIKCDGETCHL